MGGETRRAKSLRNGVHHANAVVWGPVYRTHLRDGGGESQHPGSASVAQELFRVELPRAHQRQERRAPLVVARVPVRACGGKEERRKARRRRRRRSNVDRRRGTRDGAARAALSRPTLSSPTLLYIRATRAPCICCFHPVSIISFLSAFLASFSRRARSRRVAYTCASARSRSSAASSDDAGDSMDSSVS